MMQVNGQSVTLPQQVQSVSDLLVHYGLNPKVVIVEKNGQIVDKQSYDHTPVESGDRLELVHFVGGG